MVLRDAVDHSLRLRIKQPEAVREEFDWREGSVRNDMLVHRQPQRVV